jgi:signal transduction histidine kinase
MSATQDTSFGRLVSLACHDLRTPLATIFGFARTLTKMQDLGEPATRYLSMVEIAAGQLGELLDELSLAARIESGRYEPTLQDADTAELARRAAVRLGEDRVEVRGAGGAVRVDREATERAISALAQCALRHGGLERVTVTAEGPELRVEPITAASKPVVLGEDMRDLGAAVAVRLVRSLGGSVEADGDAVVVRLPS